MLKENLNKVISVLDKKYKKVLEELNHLKADGSLSKLYNLKTTFDETFDYFFDDEDLRKKYNDWDCEEDRMLLEKTNEELLNELDEKDLEKYMKFYREYIDEMKCEVNYPHL